MTSKGPYATCKHIVAVLLMLELFSQTGEIHVKNSSTQDVKLITNQGHITTVRHYRSIIRLYYFFHYAFLVMNMIKVHVPNEQYMYTCNKIVNMIGMLKLFFVLHFFK